MTLVKKKGMCIGVECKSQTVGRKQEGADWQPVGPAIEKGRQLFLTGQYRYRCEVQSSPAVYDLGCTSLRPILISFSHLTIEIYINIH
jgi:hypothetical protein